MTDTTVHTNLLEALDVTTDLADEDINDALSGLAVDNITLTVHEPGGHLELLGVVDDGNKLLNLLVGERASAAVNLHLSLLADKVGEALAHTGNLGDGKHALAAAVNVSVQHTQDVLELRSHLWKGWGWAREGTG